MHTHSIMYLKMNKTQRRFECNLGEKVLKLREKTKICSNMLHTHTTSQQIKDFCV